MNCVNVQERIAVLTVTDMLSLSEMQLNNRITNCGASPDDAHRLVLAVGNLRHCIGQSLGLVYAIAKPMRR